MMKILFEEALMNLETAITLQAKVYQIKFNFTIQTKEKKKLSLKFLSQLLNLRKVPLKRLKKQKQLFTRTA